MSSSICPVEVSVYLVLKLSVFTEIPVLKRVLTACAVLVSAGSSITLTERANSNIKFKSTNR